LRAASNDRINADLAQILDTRTILADTTRQINMDNDTLATLVRLRHKGGKLKSITSQYEQEQRLRIERHLHIFARFDGRGYWVKMGET
jgi:hypothetical protein